MDSLKKGFTSLTSIKPNSPFHGNDENELSQEMAIKLKISNKKRPPVKPFMPTTISPASKAAVPENNIFTKRDETLDVEEHPQLSRSLSFDAKASRLLVVDAQVDVKDSLFVDSPLQPYDPIKNYLSPRPRFLRYNPDRHRKIFVRQENVTRVRRSASFDAGMPFSEEELESSADCSLGASSQEESVEEMEEIIDIAVGIDEDEHKDEKEREFDDFEEDSGWCSNVFLQYLLLMIVLILTTLTISSMNSPTISPAREAIRGYRNTRSSVYRAVGFNFSEVGGKGFALMRQTDLMVGKLSKRKIDYGYEEWDKKCLVVSADEFVEMQHGRTKDVCEDEMEGKGGGSDQLEGLETAETEDVESNKIDVSQDEEVQHEWTKDVSEDEVEGKGEGSNQLEGLETAETEEVENNKVDVNQDEMWSKKDSEQLQGSQTDESKEVEIDETEDQDETSCQLQDAIEAKKEIYGQLLGAGFNLSDVSEESEIVKLMVEEDVVGKEDSNNNGLDENEIEGIGAIDVLIKLARFNPVFAASIGVSVLILLSLSVLYYSKHVKVSSPVEIIIAHKNSTGIKNLDPFVNSSSLAYKTLEEQVGNSASLLLHPCEKEVSKETGYIRSLGTKDSILAESEESNFSLSHGKNNVSLIHTDAVSTNQAKSSRLELSTGDSPSLGSFTLEKSIVKKQKSKKAELMLSPVRRSSRIHNRSVVSP